MEHFIAFSKCLTVIQSDFSEESWHKIELRFFNIPESDDIKMKVFMITEKPFQGICDIFVLHSNEKIPCTSAAGRITNNYFLYESTVQEMLRYLDKDKLTLKFTITVFRDVISENVHTSIPMPTTSLEAHLTSLAIINLNETPTPYIIFQLKDNDYKISKDLLLATKSPYFSLICNTYGLETIENPQDIIVTINEAPETFQAMLIFIKTGLVPKSISSDTDKIMELLLLAKRYQVIELKHVCEKYLVISINATNVLKYLDLAIKSKADILKQHVICYIKFHFEELAKTQEFQELPQEYFNTIIKSFQFEMEKRCQYLYTTNISTTENNSTQ